MFLLKKYSVRKNLLKWKDSFYEKRDRQLSVDRSPQKINQGDQVKVISGKYKGKIGNVLARIDDRVFLSCLPDWTKKKYSPSLFLEVQKTITAADKKTLFRKSQIELSLKKGIHISNVILYLTKINRPVRVQLVRVDGKYKKVIACKDPNLKKKFVSDFL